MKKQLIILFVLVFILSLSSVVLAEEKTTFVKGTPIIDGVIDNIWEFADSVLLDEYNEGEANGFEVKCSMLWDEEYMYLLYEVKDDALYADNFDQPWHNDEVEVWIDETNGGIADWGDAEDDGCWFGRYDIYGEITGLGAETEAMYADGAYAATDDGYIVEVALNYATITPEIGTVIGINFSANDEANGDGVRDVWCSWFDEYNEFYDPTLLWEAQFVAGPKISTPIINEAADITIYIVIATLAALVVVVAGVFVTLKKKEKE